MSDAMAPMMVRRSRGSVSGRNLQVSATAATPYTAQTANMTRQEHQPTITAPSIGAVMGATPITSMSLENNFSAWGPSARSRTMARGMTVPAEAPSALRKRNTTSEPTLQLSQQPMEAKVYSTSP